MSTMRKDMYSDLVLKKYFLDELSAEDRDQVEREYLGDREFFDQLLMVEDELIDDYVAGELSSGERDRFERKMLATPRQREKLCQARLLLGSDHLETKARSQARARPFNRLTAW